MFVRVSIREERRKLCQSRKRRKDIKNEMKKIRIAWERERARDMQTEAKDEVEKRRDNWR